jgi:hypothetical protein
MYRTQKETEQAKKHKNVKVTYKFKEPVNFGARSLLRLAGGATRQLFCSS